MVPLPGWVPDLVVCVIGLCVGSFLNVCIARIPLEQSVATPRSRCPKCLRPIAWYDNVPVLSFLLLRARCRHCGERISWRYPLVELLTAGFAWAVYLQFPSPVAWAIWFFGFIAPLIAITFIDLDHQIIPDAFSLSGIVIGLAARPVLAPAGARLDALWDGVLGVVVGAGFLWLIAWGYERLRKHEGLGMGDVKLLGMLGAFLGWQAVILIILLSSILGTLVGIALTLIRRRGEGMKLAIPFGPFLAAAAVIHLFWGDRILDWYLDMVLR